MARAFIGVVMIYLGYSTLRIGSFRYLPRHGREHIFSTASNPAVYWAVVGGFLAVGTVLALFSILLRISFFPGDAGQSGRPEFFSIAIWLCHVRHGAAHYATYAAPRHVFTPMTSNQAMEPTANRPYASSICYERRP